jgi:hypothetical protein
MGKAAENELIKLNAAWFSNVSAGLTLTGVFIPVLAFAQNGPPPVFHELPAVFHDLLAGTFRLPDVRQCEPLAFMAAVLAFIGARVFAGEARREIAKIRD